MVFCENDILFRDINIERLSNSGFSDDEEIYVLKVFCVNVILWLCGSLRNCNI